MKPLPSLLLSLLLTLFASFALAAEADPVAVPVADPVAVPDADPVAVPVADPQAQGPAENPAPKPAATLGQRLRTVLDEEAEEMTILRERAAALRGTEKEIAVQREIQALKLRTEHRLLRLQLEHARERGHDSIAERLEEGLRALEKLVDPPAPASGASSE